MGLRVVGLRVVGLRVVGLRVVGLDEEGLDVGWAVVVPPPQTQHAIFAVTPA